MALPDLTERPPVRRMAVVRGRLAGAPMPDLGAEAATWARAAAVAAVKRASELLPLQHAAMATYVDVLLEPGPQEIVCTVTVQAFARTPIDAQALLGCAAALLTLRDALLVPAARVEALGTVQNVPP